MLKINQSFATTTLVATVCLALGLFNKAQAASLTSPEEKLVKITKQYQPQQVSLLKRLVNINSGTDNTSGVIRVGNIVKKQFEQLGFKTHWVYLPKAMHKPPMLIAEHSGKKGKRLLLIGHLDTVFSKHYPFQKMEIKKNVAIGPGVGDDKGGVVVILYALKALQAIHALQDKSITVVLTGDEEDSGKPTSISRKPLIDIAKRIDVALDFEPATEDNSVTLSRRGISNWVIEANGNEAHSASIFHQDTGAGAAFELARILNSMRDWVQAKETLTFNTGMMVAGNQVVFDKKTIHGNMSGKNNIVPKAAFASGDFRYLSMDEKQLLLTQLNKIVADHLPLTKATLTIEDAIPPMPITENNQKLLAQYSDVSEELGYGKVHAVAPLQRGAADISHVAAIIPANLGGLGVIGSGFHTKHELILLNSFTMQTARAAVLIYRLTL